MKFHINRPTIRLLNIQFALEEDQQVTISIYDLEGKMISASSQFLTAGDQSLQFDVSTYELTCR